MIHVSAQSDSSRAIFYFSSYVTWKGSEEVVNTAIKSALRPVGSNPPLPLLSYGYSFLKVRTKVSKNLQCGSIPTARVNMIMAGVVKWLTHQIVAPACVGSIPAYRLFLYY